MFKKFVVPRLLKMRFYRYCLSYFPRSFTPSDKPLTVVIPLAAKDIYRASISISSIRKHLKHPINNIYIVGQDNDNIREFCAENELMYINENHILPAVPSNKPKYNNNVRQQLIKLSVFNYINADNILVHDADTYLMRDISLFNNDRQILFISDEYTKNYEKLLFVFLGPIKRYHRSFVAHSMLFQRKFFADLNNKIRETSGLPLIEAILDKLEIANAAGLSEFEIYGNFMNTFHRDALDIRYWYNKKIPNTTKVPLEQLEGHFWNMNSISAHEH